MVNKLKVQVLRNHLPNNIFSGLLVHPISLLAHSISKKEKKRSCLGKQVNSSSSKKSSPNNIFSGLLAHPLLACFIALKWDNLKKYFWAHTFLFFSFLAFYYLYIIDIFMEDYSPLQNQTDSNQTQTLPYFLEELPARRSWFELFLAICTIMLILYEFYQMYWTGFGKYWKDIENWLQLFVYATAIFALALKPQLLSISDLGDYVRGFIALGIGLAWFEFIILFGRYPFSGGDFSIMFYIVLRKLFRYVMALFMIVGGFSSSFIVISYGTSRGGFDYPLKSFALTLAMAMGEFNSKTLYDDFKKKEYEDEKVSRTFAMILLMALILAGTITMVNLFITVIITSKEKLRQSVLEENLFYMAQSSRMIQYTGKLISCSKDSTMNSNLMQKTFCVHKICGSKCKAEKVPYNIQVIEKKLRNIAAEKIVRSKKVMSV